MPYTFRDIKVWQKAHGLALEIYKVTRLFPNSERYGLTAQFRRAVTSVPTNIVEGYKRKSEKDFAHFLNMADGSLEETKYHLILAHDLKFIDKITHDRLLIMTEEVGRMLSGFQKKLIT